MKRSRKKASNLPFIDSLALNNATYTDYLERFKRVATSMFEWENLPESMDARFLERCLYYEGKASVLKSKKYGYINLKTTGNGYVNIYGLPTKINCFSYDYHEIRDLYTGLNPDDDREKKEEKEAILVMNNFDQLPTITAMELFAYRLYMAQRTIDVNISAQRTPVIVVCDEKQRLTMENLYSQYDGNRPFIFGDKTQLEENTLKTLNTQAPYIEDKVTTYKKEIWNEVLTYLGINNIQIDKKERLTTAETSENNELINLNLQSMLAPRQEACKQMNELFGLTGTDKEISVRLRSDLRNIVKNELSNVKDLETETEDEEVIINE